MRFKTADPAVTEAIIREMLELPHSHKVRRLCADATSEKFFVANLRKSLAGRVVVEPVVSSETMEYRGEKMTVKAYLGNLLVNTVGDGRLLLPNAKWLERDLRQVKRENGSFAGVYEQCPSCGAKRGEAAWKTLNIVFTQGELSDTLRPMKYAPTIAGGLLGLAFVVFGSNFFLNFIPMPADPSPADAPH